MFCSEIKHSHLRYALSKLRSNLFITLYTTNYYHFQQQRFKYRTLTFSSNSSQNSSSLHLKQIDSFFRYLQQIVAYRSWKQIKTFLYHILQQTQIPSAISTPNSLLLVQTTSNSQIIISNVKYYRFHQQKLICSKSTKFDIFQPSHAASRLLYEQTT